MVFASYFSPLHSSFYINLVTSYFPVFLGGFLFRPRNVIFPPLLNLSFFHPKGPFVTRYPIPAFTPAAHIIIRIKGD